MDKSAIQHIQQTANIDKLIEQTKNDYIDIPTALIPENMTLKSLEPFMCEASRYRAQFVTSSMVDFIAYNTEFAREGTTCIVNPKKMNARTIFDMGTPITPLHKEHTATAVIEKTPEFKALLDITAFAVTQKQAGEFIEDWEDTLIVLTKDKNKIGARAAAKKLQDLTIEAAREVTSTVHDFGESASMFEKIEAKNQEAIPAEIEFTCEPYSGFEARTFIVRVGILTGDDKPKISLRILKKEKTEECIAQEFKDKLLDAFEDHEIKTYIGESL